MRATRFPARPLLCGAALIILAACEPNVPDSGAVPPPPPAPVIAPVAQAPLPPAPARREAELNSVSTPSSEAEDIAAETRAALGGTFGTGTGAGLSAGTDAPLAGPSADAVPTGAPIEIEGSATPLDGSGAPLPAPILPGADDTLESFSTPSAPVELGVDRNNPGLSREQDFSAVSAERGIEDDAARLRAARAQYQQVEPTVLQRPADAGPNVISYALNAARPRGSAGTYPRSAFASERRAASKCAAYRTPDVAQERFLAAGGPQADKLGLDPDGDGNACAWDPSTYATLVRG